MKSTMYSLGDIAVENVLLYSLVGDWLVKSLLAASNSGDPPLPDFKDQLLMYILKMLKNILS